MGRGSYEQEIKETPNEDMIDRIRTRTYKFDKSEGKESESHQYDQ